jgi:integrase
VARLPEVRTSLRDAVRLWLDHRAAYGRAPATIEQYRAAADRFRAFAGDIDLDAVQRDTLLQFRQQLMLGHALAGTPKAGKPLRPQTVASYLRAVINLLNWCAEMGLLNGPNPASGKGIIPKIPRDPKRSPDHTDVQRLLEAVERPDPEFRGQVRHVSAFAARSRALLWALLDSGLRVGELANLDADDYDPTRGSLHVRNGKGGHSRWVFLSPDACNALNLWMVRPREQLLRRGERTSRVAKLMGISPRAAERYADIAPLERSNGGPLFVDRLGQRMSPHGIRIWLRHLCERAGVPIYRPHDLRRLYITSAAAAGMPLPQVMQQVGHVKAETTMGYIVADAELQRQAALAASPLRRYRGR